MARKSSKTAHVMNLLAGENAGSEQESPKSEAAKENQAARQTADSPETIKELTVLAQQASIQTQEGPITPSPISIIDMTSTTPDPVAELIKQQLEDEVDGLERNTGTGEPSDGYHAADTGQSMADPEEEPMEEPAQEINQLTPETSNPIENNQTTASSIADSTHDQQPEAVPLMEEPKETAPEPNTTDSSHMASEAIEELPPEANYEYLNVMEFVVKNMVKEYMQKFDVCTCDRCTADVTALALTHLPPKYIVVERSTASPLLNFYCTRYSQHVIVELTKACSIIKENPHH